MISFITGTSILAMFRPSFWHLFLEHLTSDTGHMACFLYLTTSFWLWQTADLSHPGCPLARAVQHASQLTVLSDAPRPTTVMHDRELLLAKKDTFSEPTTSMCYTLFQLGRHSGLSCQSRQKKKHLYRAGRRKQQGRPMSVLLSSQNKHFTHLRQHCDSCIDSCNMIHVPLQSKKQTNKKTHSVKDLLWPCSMPDLSESWRNVWEFPILSWTTTLICCF